MIPVLLQIVTPLVPLPFDGSEEGGGDHGWPPSVDSFNSRPLFDTPGLEWLNNHLVQAVIGAALVIVFWLWMAHNQKVVPTKKQAVGEALYNLLRNGIARDILGHEYRRYLPYLVALFSFILVNNLFGEFFLFMFPTFSKIGYAYGLALCTFVLYNAAGMIKHGPLRYLRNMTIPHGVPWALWPVIIPLEFISNFIARPVTLALRLFANLFAGHLVIMVFVVGGGMLLTSGVLFYGIAGGVSILFSFAIFALELLVGALQAYIFTVLTAQYVSSAIADEH
ncbi:F0F1 ATP synthase subunit A [Propionicicella superfundia]|uniref:F0F1 ATP synthase subunit A n=1 Tax=Propionicicella superfundia TaxID=348582 RepID=UPI00042373B0